MKIKTSNHSAGVSACIGLALAATVCTTSLPVQAALPDVTADYRIQTIGLPPNAAVNTIFCVFMNDSGMVAIQCNTVVGPGASQGLTAVLEKGVWTAMNIPDAVWIGCGNPTARGVVPLCYGTSDGNEHNALYHKGAYEYLPDYPLPSQCGVQLINDDLIMTGLLFDPEGTCTDGYGNPCQHGVLMNRSLSLFEVFDYPGADDTAAMGLNNARQTVGQYENPDNTDHAFFSDRGKTFVNIDPPGAVSGVWPSGSMGWMINNQGEICGSYTDAATGVQQGFLLRKGKFSVFKVRAFNSTPIISTSVTCITDSGQLSGFCLDQNDNWHAFIATPRCDRH